MINEENKHLIIVYVATVAIAAILIVVIINFNRWFFPDQPAELAQFTPASRGIIGQEDLNFNLFNEQKFRSLGPLLTEEEIKKLEESEAPKPPSEGTPVTGTTKPPLTVKREVRHSNPFNPF